MEILETKPKHDDESQITTQESMAMKVDRNDLQPSSQWKKAKRINANPKLLFFLPFEKTCRFQYFICQMPLIRTPGPDISQFAVLCLSHLNFTISRFLNENREADWKGKETGTN